MLDTQSLAHAMFPWDEGAHHHIPHAAGPSFSPPSAKHLGASQIPRHDTTIEDLPQAFTYNIDFGGEEDLVNSHQEPHERHNSFSNSTIYSGSQTTDFDLQTALWCLPSHNPIPTTHFTSRGSDMLRRANKDCEYSDAANRPITPLSFFDSNYATMTNFNNHRISDSLLRIYHDVLENNLTCWLSEETCPYKMQPRRRKCGGLLENSPSLQSEPYIQPEWGAAWSNRIYRRVVRLDTIADSTKLIQLSKIERRAASKALSLVIMAFATQWSQGKKARRADTPNNQYNTEDDIADDLAEEFETNIQRSVWEQARRALNEVADLESFQVVYAELIFGLIQKPWSDEDDGQTNSVKPGVTTSDCEEYNFEEVVIPQVMHILNQQGPPVYLERAARKMHALKFRFDASEAGLQRPSKLQGTEKEALELTENDRGTIGLLYWLAVMFDTVSSSMNERPVALADDDCQHEDAQEGMTISSKSHLAYQRWVVELFVQDDPEKPTSLPQWPCPYDEAAKVVMRSAPVKVLLFRHVTYLQNALRKKQHGQPIEDAVQSATLLYKYWNKTYGTFFRALIRDYSAVPPRIKSWFVCIAVPWHLAALMLADLLDFIDDKKLGLYESRKCRLDVDLATMIRKSSATELSELAEATTPLYKDNLDELNYQIPDLHFAINEGSLLTEPWTILLIRAFTKASIFHCRHAQSSKRQERDVLGYQSGEYQDSLRLANNCNQALWFLGRKSEASRHISVILSHTLRKL